MRSGNLAVSNNWTDIKLGMWADTLLKLHPNSEWIREPTILRDSLSNSKKPDLIVTYHYDGVDVVLERATINDPVLGKITAYAVQKIIARSGNGKHCKHKGKDRRKKRR